MIISNFKAKNRVCWGCAMPTNNSHVHPSTTRGRNCQSAAKDKTFPIVTYIVARAQKNKAIKQWLSYLLNNKYDFCSMSETTLANTLWQEEDGVRILYTILTEYLEYVEILFEL